MIRGVPDRDPADRVVVLAVRGQAGAVHDRRRRPAPTRRRRASGRPERPGPSSATRAWAIRAAPSAACGCWSRPVRCAEVAAAVVAQRRLQFGRVTPAGDEVRVGVLRRRGPGRTGSRSARRPAAPRGLTLPIMPDPLPRTSSAAWSRSSGPADALRRVREQVAAALAGGVQLGHRLVEVDANAADQPCGPHELAQRLPQRGLARACAAAGGGQHDLCRVGALGQPGPLGGRADFSELLVAEVEADRARALDLLAGPAPWPVRSLLAERPACCP